MDGADKYAKKYALELGCKYIEVNPSHTPKNLYSYMGKEWYNKEYSVKNLHTRNKILAKSVDKLIAFVPEGDTANGTASTVKYAIKFNKKVVVITWFFYVYTYIYIYMRRLVMEKVKLTSVKVYINEQYKFKKACLENEMNFQKLVNRALYLYNNDEKFKNKIEQTTILTEKY